MTDRPIGRPGPELLAARFQPSQPACCCGGDICGLDEDGMVLERTFICAECDRSVPWCFGAGNDLADLCDDCAVRHPVFTGRLTDEEVCS